MTAPRHAGSQRKCPACLLAQRDDQFARREAAWAHLLAAFDGQVVIPPESAAAFRATADGMRDLQALAVVLSRADQVARADRILAAELDLPHDPAWEPRSRNAALLLMALFFACVIALSVFVERFFL